MIPVDQLATRTNSLYALVMAASKRARMVNDWRLQRARVLMEEPTPGPKPTTQALQEILDGTVSVALPEDDEA